MTKSIKALINSQVLSWARAFLGFDLDYVSHKTGFDPHLINNWEAGKESPTISQLRKMADIYRFPIAIFYLPEPPTLLSNRPKDRRFLPGYEIGEITPELSCEFRLAEERREIALELFNNIRVQPKEFGYKASLRSSPEAIAKMIRLLLQVSYQEQSSWKNPRIAFNKWREKLENRDVLVFQGVDVPLEVMRGYSMYFNVLPIIGVNRKDAYNARSFSLLHEFCHLLLRTGSICNIDEKNSGLAAHDVKIESFCNNVAGSVLIPAENLAKEPNLSIACSKGEAGEEAISCLARIYCVSKIAVVKRLHFLKYVDDKFYRDKYNKYLQEFISHKPKSAGFIHPVENLISSAGKKLVGVVLENLNKNYINISDFSSYLGIKIKHLSRLQDHFMLL